MQLFLGIIIKNNQGFLMNFSREIEARIAQLNRPFEGVELVNLVPSHQPSSSTLPRAQVEQHQPDLNNSAAEWVR